MRIDIISALFITIVAFASIPLASSKAFLITLHSYSCCCSSQCWFGWSGFNLCHFIEWNVSVLCETKC